MKCPHCGYEMTKAAPKKSTAKKPAPKPDKKR